MPSRARHLAALAVLLAAACGGDRGSSTGPVGSSTSFARIQASVFEKSCALSSCHSTANAGVSGLALTGSGVYGNLVGSMPTNTVARADGLRRVLAGKPDSSLLWHKLNGWIAGHHSHDYGAAMPLAGQALPAGQLEFIRQWIAAGASATTDAIDPKLLEGTNAALPYTALAPPAQGYQLKLQPFSVQATFEREFFDYLAVGNTQEAWVNRIQTNMRTGSHHFVLYTFDPSMPSILLPATGVIRDLRDANGTYNIGTLVAMEFHVFFGGSQLQQSDFTFPPGVAMRLPAGARIDVNSHYVNSSSTAITGEAEANLYTIPASQVQNEARALFLNNTDILVPQGRDTTIRKTFKFNQLTRVVMLTSHMHKRGTKFAIKISGGARDGETIFTTTDWAHPVILGFNTPLVLQAGEGLVSEVTYHGDAGKIVRFGLTSDDEMDIIFGYWY